MLACGGSSDGGAGPAAPRDAAPLPIDTAGGPALITDAGGDPDADEPPAHHPAPDAGFEVGPPPPSCKPVETPECDIGPAIRYGDVQPIFNQRCVSCHYGMTDGPWPLTRYEDIVDWGVLIREDLNACVMPPADSNVTLPEDEKIKILTWIKCGLRK